MQTVYIVTPVFNGATFIDRCIQSVLSQSGAFRIRYHVQDGGSNDGTVESLEAWKKRVKNRSIPISCCDIEFSFSSEKDASMYDALEKGFNVFGDAPADAFLTWINYDDILLPGACALAATLDEQFEKREVAWFTGMHNTAHLDGCPTPLWAAPLPREIIANGVADGLLAPTVQQEGTFFRRWLWDSVDKTQAFGELRFAGDWNLWRLMAAHAPLYQLNNMATGRFSRVNGQLSQGREGYTREIDSIVGRSERIERHRTLLQSDNLHTPTLEFGGNGGEFRRSQRPETSFSLLYLASRKVPERLNDYQQEIAEQKAMEAEQEAARKAQEAARKAQEAARKEQEAVRKAQEVEKEKLRVLNEGKAQEYDRIIAKREASIWRVPYRLWKKHVKRRRG
ncbi:glycosyltransferase [Ruegeria lacuscaerulensis]|uniref:glycosyltransferase n=1 Tax=Ruegeria lacuscaerulensis TaxID=55218 RepID=UPI00147FA214|nr:glycosyltransferase [Ruegeria lacuscaerulensis]